ncbi:MAG: ATP-binding protein [Alphaproteobacteria bacterium]|nr:MAG: ATP-binding protein [Alphaproteobacteria bacterium]
MLASCRTVIFEGVQPRVIEVQCRVTAGLPSLAIVGLPDKAVSEARERMRTALAGLGVTLPSARVLINLSPADLPKRGSHFDLPIALAALAASGAFAPDALDGVMAIGELALDGRLVPVPGALPAAIAAAAEGVQLLLPAESAHEAAWAGDGLALPVPDLGAALAHLTGNAPIAPAPAGAPPPPGHQPDMAEIRGHATARRALEVAAAGGHHLLLLGPPGIGKSMLAARLPSILPPPSPAEALEAMMIHSLAGEDATAVLAARPFRQPHHTASPAAIVGGGRGAGPGEVALAHGGVLFLDELPEFAPSVLETLRQPLETGRVTVARAEAHVTYPCRFQLVAAANPCRCGHLGDPDRACRRAPICSERYLGRISGPLLDRIDIRLDLPALSPAELAALPPGEPSAVVRERVRAARAAQAERWAEAPAGTTNATAPPGLLQQAAALEPRAEALLARAAEQFRLSPRGWDRAIRLARTIADLAGEASVGEDAMAEALFYRLAGRGAQSRAERAALPP